MKPKIQPPGMLCNDNVFGRNINNSKTVVHLLTPVTYQ